ncbi:MAG: hypothetical protein ACK4V6_06590, partial [Microthrixaceae bacterium]
RDDGPAMRIRASVLALPLVLLTLLAKSCSSTPSDAAVVGNSSSGVDAPTAAAEINDWMRRTAVRGDNDIINWAAAAEDGGRLLRPDRIHPNDRGRTHLVQMMRDAVGSC